MNEEKYKLEQKERFRSKNEEYKNLYLLNPVQKPKTSYLVCIDIEEESEFRLGSLQGQLQRAGFKVTNLCRTEQFEGWKEFEEEQKRIEGKSW